MKVLVVEDDAAILELVSMKLKRGGYDVLTESDGESGLAAVLEEQPDLVILDVTMPRLTGFDVCRAMRADQRAKHIEVLMLTARAQEADIEEGFTAGASDYMVKPFRGREMISRVESLLAKNRRVPR